MVSLIGGNIYTNRFLVEHSVPHPILSSTLCRAGTLQGRTTFLICCTVLIISESSIRWALARSDYLGCFSPIIIGYISPSTRYLSGNFSLILVYWGFLLNIEYWCVE